MSTVEETQAHADIEELLDKRPLGERIRQMTRKKPARRDGRSRGRH